MTDIVHVDAHTREGGKVDVIQHYRGLPNNQVLNHDDYDDLLKKITASIIKGDYIEFKNIINQTGNYFRLKDIEHQVNFLYNFANNIENKFPLASNLMRHYLEGSGEDYICSPSETQMVSNFRIVKESANKLNTIFEAKLTTSSFGKDNAWINQKINNLREGEEFDFSDIILKESYTTMKTLLKDIDETLLNIGRRYFIGNDMTIYLHNPISDIIASLIPYINYDPIGDIASHNHPHADNNLTLGSATITASFSGKIYKKNNSISAKYNVSYSIKDVYDFNINNNELYRKIPKLYRYSQNLEKKKIATPFTTYINWSDRELHKFKEK